MTHARPSFFSLFLALTLLLTAGCKDKPAADAPPLVVVSVLPQAWLVERIAGDAVDVEVMVPPGASPATWEPTMRQMKALSDADLYVKVGHPNFPFEKAWLDRLLAQNPSMPTVDGAAGLKVAEDDPHVWVSPPHVRTMASGLRDALVELSPEDEATFDRNLKALDADVEALHEELSATLGPHRGKNFFVFHPSWGYFAQAYGLEQVAIEESGREPSPKELARIVDKAKAEDVHVIFVQPQFSRRSAEVVAKEIDGEVVPIDPLARDWLANMKKVQAAFASALAGEP